MSERFPTDPLVAPLPDIRLHAPLPPWLERRLLGPREHITWVRGPRFNSSWERYVTHPALFLFALALAAGLLIVGLSWGAPGDFELLFAGAIAIVYGTIIALGIFAGYFTRLVVTNFRVVILQGYEVRRSWGLDELPPSLIRYGNQEGREGAAVDLDAVQNMLGASDQFADPKAIRTFGKQLDQIWPWLAVGAICIKAIASSARMKTHKARSACSIRVWTSGPNISRWTEKLGPFRASVLWDGARSHGFR
jgi:hypothetical protein